jgi:hypothetical protein
MTDRRDRRPRLDDVHRRSDQLVLWEKLITAAEIEKQ